MADNRVKGRVRGLLGGGASPDDVQPEHHSYEQSDPESQRALQVLVLAQRTADGHVATAQHQADNIRAEAQARAEQIVREAQAHADGARRDAEKVLTDARATAQQIAKDAQAKAAGLEREAQQRYDDVVGSLSAKRDDLQEQIDSLQKFDLEYRARLSKFMQGQLRALGVVDEPLMTVPAQQPAAVAGGDL